MKEFPDADEASILEKLNLISDEDGEEGEEEGKEETKEEVKDEAKEGKKEK